MVEQQAEELFMDPARRAEGGRHKRNALVVGIVRLVLRNFFPGRIPEGLVEVGRAAQLALLVRVVRIATALVREGEVEDEVAGCAAVMEKFPNLNIPTLPAPAGCHRRLDPHLVTEGSNRRAI